MFSSWFTPNAHSWTEAVVFWWFVFLGCGVGYVIVGTCGLGQVIVQVDIYGVGYAILVDMG